VNNTTIRNLTFHVHKIVVPFLIACRTEDIIRCLYLKMKRPCLYYNTRASLQVHYDQGSGYSTDKGCGI